MGCFAAGLEKFCCAKWRENRAAFSLPLGLDLRCIKSDLSPMPMKSCAKCTRLPETMQCLTQRRGRKQRDAEDKIMELMPLGIHGGRGPVFVLPHFAKQNFTNPAATAVISHRGALPTNPLLEPAPAGLGLVGFCPDDPLSAWAAGERTDPRAFGGGGRNATDCNLEVGFDLVFDLG